MGAAGSPWWSTGATAVHGRSIAWTRDRCRLVGAYRPLLYAVAVHADKHYGACSAGSRRLAASAGISTTWVKRLLHELELMGVLECLEPGAGRRAACYRFTPSLLDGEPRSGQPTSPQPSSVAVNSEVRSGQLGDPVVVTPPSRSGQLDAGPYRNEEKSIEEKSTEESATSALDERALVAGRADARPAATTTSQLAQEWDAAVHAFDPDAEYDRIGSNVTADGWMLSNGHYLPARYAAQWVKRQQDEEARQEQAGEVQR